MSASAARALLLAAGTMIFQQLPVQFLDVRNACRIDPDAGEFAGV